MKKVVLFLFIFALLSSPFSVLASSFDNYIIMDMKSKRVFYEKNPNAVKLPASTTKIMTLILAIENSNLYDVVTVGDEILTMDGANIYVEMGEKILMQDLMYGMILRSGNDAAMVIAKHVSGSVPAFVKLMNEKARALGLKNTKFNNPTGLDDFEKNYSTVYDLALLYSYCYKNPIFRDIIGTLDYKSTSSSKSYYFINRSKSFVSNKLITGSKTGYTPSAGRILVSSASDNHLNLVISSMGNSYGYDEHISFYEDIFANYKNYLILDKNDIKLKPNCYIKNSFSYPIASYEKNKISKEIIYNKNKSTCGYVLVYLSDELIHKEKIYSYPDNQSFFDKIKQFFSVSVKSFGASFEKT